MSWYHVYIYILLFCTCSLVSWFHSFLLLFFCVLSLISFIICTFIQRYFFHTLQLVEIGSIFFIYNLNTEDREFGRYSLVPYFFSLMFNSIILWTFSPFLLQYINHFIFSWKSINTDMHLFTIIILFSLNWAFLFNTCGFLLRL